MIPGLMQPFQLQTSTILKYAASAHGSREIVSRGVDEPVWRYDFQAFELRARRLAMVLQRLGLQSGDRVTSLAWNTHRHLELFYGVTGSGAVLHTANPRLSDEQIAFTINHAQSKVLFVERNLFGTVLRLRSRLPEALIIVLLSASHLPESSDQDVLLYEELLAAEGEQYSWPTFDENAGAFLCYTSGTTGDPKGVLYSHRAVVLHAMGSSLASAFGLGAFDVVLPCVPLFHATAWGLAFSTLLSGAKLVLPCDKMDGASLNELVTTEGVTFICGVPTIFTSYLTYLDLTGASCAPLNRAVIGGSAVPRAMTEAFKQKHNVDILQIWGMTEMCPLGVVSTPTPALAAAGADQMREVIWTRQGRLQFGVELKIVLEDGSDAPADGKSPGALLVRGPWCLQRYYRQAQDAVDASGWFDTGDIATLDSYGFVRITDRTKDVIKSGGEWISSIDLENIAAGCDGVKIAAVVGVPHPKWEERPLLIIERHDHSELSAADILAYVAPRIPKWWTPDDIIFGPVPLTATGKINKKSLRATYANHLMAARPEGGENSPSQAR